MSAPVGRYLLEKEGTWFQKQMWLRATQPCLCRREGWRVAGAKPVRLLFPPWGAGCGAGGSVQGAAHNRPGALPAAWLNTHPVLGTPRWNPRRKIRSLDMRSWTLAVTATPWPPSMTPALFFLIFILYLCWSIVDLQSCVNFRCSAIWFSYTYTCIHCFSNAFPI